MPNQLTFISYDLAVNETFNITPLSYSVDRKNLIESQDGFLRTFKNIIPSAFMFNAELWGCNYNDFLRFKSVIDAQFNLLTGEINYTTCIDAIASSDNINGTSRIGLIENVNTSYYIHNPSPDNLKSSIQLSFTFKERNKQIGLVS